METDKNISISIEKNTKCALDMLIGIMYDDGIRTYEDIIKFLINEYENQDI
jgi:hypothetical protein